MATLDQETQILGEIETSKQFIKIGEVRILSGAYKSRKVRVGGSGGRYLTKEQLLDDELKTMESHAHKIHEMYEKLAEIRYNSPPTYTGPENDHL